MPNVISREKLEDILYMHGIRDPLKLNLCMRAIDSYVNYEARIRWPELFTESVLTPVNLPNLEKAWEPGDPEMMIRCSECGIPKRAADNYHHRKDTETGWGHKCTTCMPKPLGRPIGYSPPKKKKKEETDDLPSL